MVKSQMRKAIATWRWAALVVSIAAAGLCQEVQIPFDGEQSRYVTFYKAPAESGLTRFSKEDGRVLLEWLGKTEKSKAVFNAPLFEGILADLRKGNLAPVEFVVGIRYDGADLPRLETYLYSSRLTQLKPFYFRLKQGYAEYSTGYDDLANLEQYQIRGGARKFTVEKIAFKVSPKKETFRKLQLKAMRKTFEVLPDGGVLEDFVRSPATAGSDSDVKLSVQIADGVLKIHSETAMPEKPKADARKRDDAVFWDDALELFLSPQLDNRSYAQISINAANVVYDAEYGYDPVAAGWGHRKEVDYDFRSSTRHEDGILKIDAELPLAMLKFNPNKSPLLAFQAGFNRNSPKVYYSWKPTIGNLKTKTYGMLYFNAEPFGPGELKFTDGTMAESSRRMSIDAEGANFTEPAYDVEMIVTAPDFSVARQTLKQVPLNGKVRLEFPGVKDFNGDYSVILAVKNRRKAIRPFVANFTNVKAVSYPYGQKKIFPYPKQLKWLTGYFHAGEHSTLDLPSGATARTRRTAELLQEKLKGRGLDYRLTENTGAGIVLRIQPEGLKPEGYRLEVSPERITLTGADERGLYYATVTLHQIMNMEMNPRNSVPVPCVEIVDAPDLKYRMAPFWFPDQVGMPIKERASMDFFLDHIDRFVAGGKLNILKVRGIETLIRYDEENIPAISYNSNARFLTWADLERLAKFCDDRFIDLMISLPAGGHDYWISLYGFREKGWDTGDVSNPEYEKIYFDIADKMIRHTGCRYFSPESDEWWHKRSSREEADDTVRGRPRSQVFLDFHLKLHSFLKERGVRMAMCEDMINPAHNGPRYDTWKIVDSLPRDIIILVWADIGDAVGYFGEKGFECWGFTTGWITFKRPSRKHVTGYGASLYGFGSEYKFRIALSFSFHSSLLMGANYAWNFNNGSLDWNYADWMNSGELAAAEAVFAVNDNPYGDEKCVALDIGKCFNASASAFADGSQTVCNIPMRLDGNSGRNCVETRKGAPQTIPIHQKCSSLIFLHTSIPGESYKSYNGNENRSWQRGYPAVEYTVVYDDGTQSVHPARINQEIYFEDWQPQAGGTVFCRGMKIGYDADRLPHFAYQWELVNPHPEKEIAEIRIAIPNNKWDFTHRLLALTLREVGKNYGLMIGKRLRQKTTAHHLKTRRAMPGEKTVGGIARSFRGVWIATVYDTRFSEDLSKKTIDEIKCYWRSILDAAERVNVNAVFFQVRPCADGWYRGSLEPWSMDLRGEQGKEPEDGFDPLQFMIDECHSRGMQLHAWFNPFRVTYNEGDEKRLAADHNYFKHPDWFVKYGKSVYYDPGIPECREWTLRVVMDVASRYEIDGIHIDDYFYPYPVLKEGKNVPFPDEKSFAKYGRGFASLDDWRASNVDSLISAIAHRLRELKPDIPFGVSPFHSHAYCVKHLYADTLKWARSGWIDYVIPQLYYGDGTYDASFWWDAHVDGCPFFAGRQVAALNKTVEKGPRMGTPELENMLQMHSQMTNLNGVCWWSGHVLGRNPSNVVGRIAPHYAKKALVPLYRDRPSASAMPVADVSASACDSRVTITWRHPVPGKGQPKTVFTAIFRGDESHPEIVTDKTTATLDGHAGETFRLVALDRLQNASKSTCVQWITLVAK